MFPFYNRVAGWLKRFRTVLWVMLCGSVIAFGWVVLNPVNPEKNPVFLGAFLLFGWTICLLVIEAYFSQPIKRPIPTDSFFLTCKKRFLIALSWGLALLVTVFAVEMVLLMVRVFNIMTTNVGGG